MNQQWMNNQGCGTAHRFHCLICKARNEGLLWIPKRRHSRQAKMKNPIYCKSRIFAICAFVQRQESLSTRRRRKKKWEGKKYLESVRKGQRDEITGLHTGTPKLSSSFLYCTMKLPMRQMRTSWCNQGQILAMLLCRVIK